MKHQALGASGGHRSLAAAIKENVACAWHVPYFGFTPEPILNLFSWQ